MGIWSGRQRLVEVGKGGQEWPWSHAKGRRRPEKVGEVKRAGRQGSEREGISQKLQKTGCEVRVEIVLRGRAKRRRRLLDC